MNRKIQRTMVGLGAFALVVPAATAAHGKSRSHQHKPKQNSTVAYQFKGTLVDADAQSETAVVEVERANRHARAFRGDEVTFDLSRAKLVVADRNGDGSRDLADTAPGDRVKVLARMPRRLAPTASQPFPAKRMVDLAPSAGSSEPTVETSRRGRRRR